MTEANEINWKPIIFCGLALLTGLAVGSFWIGPALQKAKNKKEDSEKE